MRKFFFSLIILFLCLPSAFSQVKQPLDEQITQENYKDDVLSSKHIAETIRLLKDAGATLIK